MHVAGGAVVDDGDLHGVRHARSLVSLDVTGVVLRGPVELADPLEVALAFFEAYGPDDPGGAPEPDTFDERDLRRANRGGARISAAEQAAVLARRRQIEAALREIPFAASLAGRAVPWAPLTRLF